VRAAIGVVEALGADHALLGAGLHESEVLLQVVEDEERVAARGDRCGNVVLPAHRRGHPDDDGCNAHFDLPMIDQMPE